MKGFWRHTGGKIRTVRHFSFFVFVVVHVVVVLGGYSVTDSLDKKADDSLKIKVNIWFKLPCSACEQWFLQAGRYAAKGEKLLLATVCFSIKHARPRDAYVNTSNDFTSSCFAGNISLHAQFCIFLCRLCTKKTWKCLISRFRENVNKQRRNFVSLSELGFGPLELQLGSPTYNKVSAQ